MGKLASERLVPGAVYTRGDLKALFEIHDATLNNGIFRPKEYDSVWLFVTERKTRDRTQYVDTFTGDTLHMEGQLKGRTDSLILDHRKRGLELLVFHRTRKYEHPGAGFRFEGAFTYESHSGGSPTSFVLRRKPASAGDAVSTEIERELDTQRIFNPGDISDARERTMASIVRRRGQPRFRKQLLKAYQGRCAVTGCALEPILEAAHIHPYLGDETNVVSNGLLLRTDVHTLFDLGLMWIEPHNLRVRLSEQLRHSEYDSLEGQTLWLPTNELDHPSRPALEFRFKTQRKGKVE